MAYSGGMRHIPSDRPAAPVDAKIRGLFLEIFVDAARDKGCNTTQLLRQVGLTPDIVATPYAWIRFDQYIAFTELVAEKTGDPMLGLELGASFSPSELGPFHVLTMTATTPLEVLHAYMKFQNHWQTNSSLELHRVDEERSEIRYFVERSDIWPRRQDAEFSLASINRCMREALGGLWRPSGVRFEHDISGQEAALRKTFRCPPLGDQEHSAIVIPSQILTTRLHTNTLFDLGHLKPVLETHLMDLMRIEPSQDIDLIEQTRLAITKRLASNKVTLLAVAYDVGMPERTLRRHLAQNNVTFRELLQTQRMRRACQLLESRANIPLEQLAEQLGYADAASFGRAFKSWKGVSPRRYASDLARGPTATTEFAINERGIDQSGSESP